MLYALLLDRMYLSARNGWVDRYGRVYQFFTIKQGQELLHFGHDKIIRLFGELEKADLIQRNRQGQGKANIIYLKSFEIGFSDFQKSIKQSEVILKEQDIYLPQKKYIYLLNIAVSKIRKEFYEKNKKTVLAFRKKENADFMKKG